MMRIVIRRPTYADIVYQWEPGQQPPINRTVGTRGEQVQVTASGPTYQLILARTQGLRTVSADSACWTGEDAIFICNNLWRD